MADMKRGTAIGPQRAELRLLLKSLDPETQGEIIVDINPDDPELSAEDAAAGIELLSRLVKQRERENERKGKEKNEIRDGCLSLLGIAVLLLLVLGWCGSG